MTGQPGRRAMAGYMNMQPAAPETTRAPYFVMPGEGRAINAGGMPARVVLEPEDCGGALMGQVQEFLPGQSTRAHRHLDVTQVSIVTEGVLWFGVGGEVRQVPRGGLVRRPPGVDHIVFNAGSELAAHAEIHLPGGVMKEFFDAYGDLAAVLQLAEPGTAEKLAAEFGTLFNDDLTARILAAYPGVSPAAGAQR